MSNGVDFKKIALENRDLLNAALAREAALREEIEMARQVQEATDAIVTMVDGQRDRWIEKCGLLKQRLTVAEQRAGDMTAKLGDAYEWGYGDGQNSPNGYSDKEDRDKCVAELLKPAAELPPMNPVEGDKLPPIGGKVFIHLSSSDSWVEHTVAGYYVWNDLQGDTTLHRVFVRVRDSAGYLNARLLKDIRLSAED